MKTLLLFLIGCLSASAFDNTNVVLYNETLFNKETYTVSNYKGDYKNSSNIYQNRFKLKLYTDINDDLKFTTLGVYSFNNIDDVYKLDVMRNDTYKSSEAYFESMYLTYNVYKNFYVIGGLVSFSEGSYNELSELDYIKGAGLSKIINTPIEALFLLYRGEFLGYRTLTRLGYGVYDGSSLPKGSYLQEEPGGSKGYYFTYDMYKNFDSVKFNYFEGDINRNSTVVAHSKTMGVGFNKYFLKEGINIFSTLGYCSNDVYGANLKSADPKIKFLQLLHPKAFNFNNNHSTGYLYSLGVAYDIDSNIVESYNVGVDFTHTSKNWYSLVNNDYNDVYNSRFMAGDNTYMWFTTKVTKDIAVKLYGVKVTYSNSRPLGDPTQDIKYSDALDKRVKYIDRLGVKVIMKY